MEPVQPPLDAASAQQPKVHYRPASERPFAACPETSVACQGPLTACPKNLARAFPALPLACPEAEVPQLEPAKRPAKPEP
jgi:hypothetical protein